VDDELRQRLGAAAYGRDGFAADYDRYRPRPPAALLDLLPPLAGVERPRLVVDLGSGSGLSTRVWASAAQEVVGVELNEAMREFAAEVTEAPSVRYVGASAYETTLADGSADIVTAAQSLQWMAFDRVLPEVARILRPGGVFCAYNYFRLQTPAWEATSAFERVQQRKGEFIRASGHERRGSRPRRRTSRQAATSGRCGTLSSTPSRRATGSGCSASGSARAACGCCSNPV
jgi:SAM-dependent methyltransferase